MSVFAYVAIGVVISIHLFLAWFEMFSWLKTGPKIFKHMPKELFAPTKSMAANQGLYNGFLAIGLIWTLFINDPQWQASIATCFLLFVICAGFFGAYTSSIKALISQSIPALIALALLYFS